MATPKKKSTPAKAAGKTAKKPAAKKEGIVKKAIKAVKKAVTPRKKKAIAEVIDTTAQVAETTTAVVAPTPAPVEKTAKAETGNTPEPEYN